MKLRQHLSTGLPELDRVFRGLMPGDNIVWQVDSIGEYLPFIQPYAAYARENRQKLFYFRFADHQPLLEPGDGVEIIPLSPAEGFEPFLSQIHRVIDSEGRGSLYLFDCLSELDAYRHKGKLYLHPIKVQHRHSATMYMLHVWEGEEFLPVTQSGVITEILEGVPWSRMDAASWMRGFWSKTFAEAEGIQAALDRGEAAAERAEGCFHRLLHMLISHDPPVLRLAEKYFTLRDILQIRRRMIGTGLIGGKSVGMLLARAVLRAADPRWVGLLEAHDSFYVGADVFYTYLVQNGCWWMMQKHKLRGSDHGDDESETARRRILAGEFPDYIVKQFADMLDYFGQSPIIVRSSSLLEDNFGNAFAGKYESVFCANQGGPHKRLEDFLCAVRTVYASTMSEEALAYRAQRGLLKQDEQMALLIQRVSGATYGNLFYPQAAGVGFSFNPYVWHESIDPAAGMLRLVFGVGTRAVDRADDDYTRVVALNAPARRPEANFDEVREYAQRRVDVLDLEANQLISAAFEEIVQRSGPLPIEMFASRDQALERRAAEAHRRPVFSWVLTFDKLLTETAFVADMREILRVIQEAYGCPVDIEFTLNFFDGESYKVNLVQCRPLQVGSSVEISDLPESLPEEGVILEARGAVIGKSNLFSVDWLIYVIPSLYGELPMGDRYAVARLIGDIVHHRRLEDQTLMLLGPGRWGTTTPALGVPVSFAEINQVRIVCEIVAMRENLIPDVSLGTHFFNELVENDMLYTALFPKKEGNLLNRRFFEEEAPDCLDELVREEGAFARAVRVIRVADLPEGPRVRLCADTLKQRVLGYLEPRVDEAE